MNVGKRTGKCQYPMCEEKTKNTAKFCGKHNKIMETQNRHLRMAKKTMKDTSKKIILK